MLMEQGREALACAAHRCAMVVRTWRRSRAPVPRERSVHKRTHAPSASMGCDDRGCVGFPQHLSRSAQENIRGRCLCASDQSRIVQRSIANPGSGTQRSVPRLRDRMQERRALAQARKRPRLCISCATRTIVVQIGRKRRPLRECLRAASNASPHPLTSLLLPRTPASGYARDYGSVGHGAGERKQR